MIVFQIVHDQRARAVMNEFGTFIKEGTIIFISFNDKKGGFTETGREWEVARYATDQEAGFQTRMFQNPRHHAGGRRFAVCASYTNHPTLLQDVIAQPFRT